MVLMVALAVVGQQHREPVERVILLSPLHPKETMEEIVLLTLRLYVAVAVAVHLLWVELELLARIKAVMEETEQPLLFQEFQHLTQVVGVVERTLLLAAQMDLAALVVVVLVA